MKVYVVERIKTFSEHDDGTTSAASELMGVFETPELAEAACTKLWDIIMPVDLNVVAPEETCSCPGAYYPNASSEDIPAAGKL